MEISIIPNLCNFWIPKDKWQYEQHKKLFRRIDATLIVKGKMNMREALDRVLAEAYSLEDISIRPIRDDYDLWCAVVECRLKPGQEEFVNPAGFSIGRAYLDPENNVPCIICKVDGTRIGYIVLRNWSSGDDAYSWSYYLDRDYQGIGYGKKAAQLAVQILKAANKDMPIKLSTETDNRKAQRLYVSEVYCCEKAENDSV